MKNADELRPPPSDPPSSMIFRLYILYNLQHHRRCHSRYHPLRLDKSFSQARQNLASVIVGYTDHELCQRVQHAPTLSIAGKMTPSRRSGAGDRSCSCFGSGSGCRCASSRSSRSARSGFGRGRRMVPLTVPKSHKASLAGPYPGLISNVNVDSLLGHPNVFTWFLSTLCFPLFMPFNQLCEI